MSVDEVSIAFEALCNLDEADGVLRKAREDILDYDWYSIPESDLSEMCAYSKILLKQVKEATASMIDRMEGKQ